MITLLWHLSYFMQWRVIVAREEQWQLSWIWLRHMIVWSCRFLNRLCCGLDFETIGWGWLWGVWRQCLSHFWSMKPGGVMLCQAVAYVRESRSPPTYFFFVSKGLSSLLQRVVESKSITGYCICSNAPAISHLLRWHSNLLWGKAGASVQDKRTTIHLWESIGAKSELLKTTVSFNKAFTIDKRRRITHCLDIREVLSHGKYLDLLTVIGRSKKKLFLFIIDHIKSKLSGWMGRLIS